MPWAFAGWEAYALAAVPLALWKSHEPGMELQASPNWRIQFKNVN